MTLYGFFASKDELVSQLGTHALGSIAPAPDPKLSWRDQLKNEWESCARRCRSIRC